MCRAGRALQADGSPDPGLYVVGWAKRGPTGIIGEKQTSHLARHNSSLCRSSISLL